MKDKLKTGILIIVILIVAIIMIWCAYIIINSNDSSEIGSNITNEQNEIETNSINSVKNTIEDVEENVEENNLENEVINEVNNNVTSTSPTEVTKNTGATNEEKAINIVKKNWGSEEGVYFVTMGIDANGRYIVTVNDSATTAIYAWYAVNIETGEFQVQ